MLNKYLHADYNKQFNYNYMSINEQRALKRKKCFIYTFITLMGSIILIMSIWWLHMRYSSNTDVIIPPIYCDILERNTVRPYPYPYLNSSESESENKTNISYYISFNETIMQADFVKYIQPLEMNECKTCQFLRPDPYGINELRDGDYKETGFIRGKLVPNADYGKDTFIISNVIPMNSIFNQGIWMLSEMMIRNEYKTKLIYKGCDYDESKYVITDTNKTLYIPKGCSYLVFNTNNISQIKNLELLDYGYYENSNTTTELKKKLPDWVTCKNKENRNINDQVNNIKIGNNNDNNNNNKGLHMLTFKPGEYTLSPQDYGFVDYLVAEIWGAGGSGGTPFADGIDNNGSTGGGSGAYIKATIKTNQKNIHLNVGSGGSGTVFINLTRETMPPDQCNATSGQKSMIITDDITLIAEGGKTGCVSDIQGGKAGKAFIAFINIKNPVDTNNIILINGNDGLMYYDVIANGPGGDAPGGGKGGSSRFNPSFCNSKDNGKIPGGGGNAFIIQCGSFNEPRYVDLSSGGDGMINIYFDL